MNHFIWTILFLSMSSQAIVLSFNCDILKGNIKNNFSGKAPQVSVSWKIEAVEICKINAKDGLEKANIHVLSAPEKNNKGYCTYKRKKAFWSNQKPSWPSDLVEHTMYGKSINKQCPPYDSPTISYIDLELLPNEINREHFFLSLISFFDQLNGDEKKINKALSAIPVLARWFCEDCTALKMALLSSQKSKRKIFFADSITTVVNQEDPDEQEIIITLIDDATLFQIFVEYENDLIEIKDVSVVRFEG